MHLRTGNPVLAEPQARHALELLAGREDALDEIGNVQLVLGRSLLEQSRFEEAAEWLQAAERTFERFESPSLLAAAWIAQGDLALARSDADPAAAPLPARRRRPPGSQLLGRRCLACASSLRWRS